MIGTVGSASMLALGECIHELFPISDLVLVLRLLELVEHCVEPGVPTFGFALVALDPFGHQVEHLAEVDWTTLVPRVFG